MTIVNECVCFSSVSSVHTVFIIKKLIFSCYLLTKHERNTIKNIKILDINMISLIKKNLYVYEIY